ncbi:hypothetical protein TRFO_01046 [Tritrichomonas foetus]|uniref:Tetratricopeptide repeat protein n=1 Tax=Tritrichomonas foetus TaxID=1144522 RepID=A0A1J4KIH4_9EUKA|nr:hypothetical protein TRFO_01046 [Tritrichomonas foetus]|eukprot:OHT11151.1 hypothetical protein TRFO_01046 [Tritrichomonas foetus]
MSSIENYFRMAQALNAQGKYDLAIQKYLKVCQTTESVLKSNSDVDVELVWTIYSLGYISDIYSSQKIFNKALLFRNTQEKFLSFLKDANNADLSDPDLNNKVSTEKSTKVNGKMESLLRLFENIQIAIDCDSKEAPQEDRDEIVKKVQFAFEKSREEKVNKIFEQLQNQNNNFKKNLSDRVMDFIVEHYLIMIFGAIFIGILVVLFFAFTFPRRNLSAVPKDFRDQINALENYVKAFESNEEKEKILYRGSKRVDTKTEL